MAKMSDKYNVASARYGKMVATAGEEPVAYHMRLHARVIKTLDGKETVLDVGMLDKAKAAYAMLVVNGGYLMVNGQTVTKVVCALKELPAPKDMTTAIFTHRGGKGSDPDTAYVRFVFSEGKPRIVVKFTQAEKLRLKPEDLMDNDGPFYIRF